MGLLEYTAYTLLTSLALSAIVLAAFKERAQLIYYRFSPFVIGVIYFLIPFIFSSIGNQVFHKPDETSDCGIIFIAVAFFQLIFACILTPFVIFLSYIFTRIAIKDYIDQKKRSFPSDAEKDKW